MPTPPPELIFHDKKRIEKPPPSFWKLRFRYLHFCVWKTPRCWDKINAQTHNQNQRRWGVVNIFEVPLVIKVVLNFSNYSECYQTCVEVMISFCGRLTMKLRACFRQSLNRHDVSLNITFGSFVWRKKKVRSIFSSMREAYPYPARGVKNEAKLVSEKYLCKNLFHGGFEPTWFQAKKNFRQKGKLPGLSTRWFEPPWFISNLIWIHVKQTWFIAFMAH